MHNSWVQEEIRKEIKYFQEFNENADTTYPSIWDTLKTVLRGKFIVLKAHMKTQENNHIRELTAQLKALENKETNTRPEEQTPGNNQIEG